MRYFITLSYNGANYSGWQIQPNGISVQQKLQEALSLVLRVRTSVAGAGRTDTGVHAKKMVAHFDFDSKIEIDLAARLNSVLPKDISIQNVRQVNNRMHARFSALSRTYHYHLIFDRNPFLHNLAYRHHTQLDFDMMNQAASMLLNYTDFTSFSKVHTFAKTRNCKVYHAEWLQQSDVWVFTIKANRFLRNMVRAIVGTLLKVGEGKISIDDFCKIIEKKDRCEAGQSVAAKGLYLVDIEYNED